MDRGRLLFMSDKEFIDLIVDAFYTKAVNDFLIGYHFRKIAQSAPNPEHPLSFSLGAFTHHLPRIKTFWYNQLLGEALPSNQDPFDLISIHRNLNIRPGEVNRWLYLFRQEIDQAKNNDTNQLAQQWHDKLDLFQQIFHRKLFMNKN
jgi:truncated hemoglobin YjbI